MIGMACRNTFWYSKWLKGGSSLFGSKLCLSCALYRRRFSGNCYYNYNHHNHHSYLLAVPALCLVLQALLRRTTTTTTITTTTGNTTTNGRGSRPAIGRSAHSSCNDGWVGSSRPHQIGWRLEWRSLPAGVCNKATNDYHHDNCQRGPIITTATTTTTTADG